MRIIVKDSSIEPIEGNPHMLKLAILSRGLQEFWVMLCISGVHRGKCYIEEYVSTTIDFKGDIFGNFKFVQDDELAEELTRFAEDKKLTDMGARAGEMVETGLGRIVFGNKNSE